MTPFYIDIETVPNDKEAYLAASEEGRKKLLNPIDSHIVAIGIKQKGQEPTILFGVDEKKLLTAFWATLQQARQGKVVFQMVGFNIKDFDLPFLVTRSFLSNVKIVPFLVKEVMDVREQLSAFKYGHTRGKLKEYGQLLGLDILDGMDGSNVAELFWGGEHEKIQTYLKKDLEITEAMHQRMVELRISEIQRW